MALKDLVAKKAELTEEAIEAVVSEYVRYDIDDKEIVLTPTASGLSNKGKVLIYLVALQGWPFVADESIPVDVKPADLTDELGIPGGTLRPLLKDLKDRHILSTKGGRYFARAVNLETIKAEIGTPSGKPRKPSRKSKKNISGTEKAETANKKNSGTKAGQMDKFKSWIENGFFDTPKALSDVHARFHQEAIIVPQTSVSGLLLGGVRNGLLVRNKMERDGKQVWVYRTKSAVD